MKEFVNIVHMRLGRQYSLYLDCRKSYSRILNLAKQLQSRVREEVVYRQIKNDDTAAPSPFQARSDLNYRSSSSSSSLSSSIEEIIVMLDVLNKNAKRPEKLTSNLLDVSRIENIKSLELSKENFDLVQEIYRRHPRYQVKPGEKEDTLEIITMHLMSQ